VKVSKSEEYGLRLVMSLATDGGQLAIRELAEREGLPEATVAKVIGRLRRAELVEAVRGRHGGYTLSRPAESVTLAEVVAAFDDALVITDFCRRMTPGDADCVRAGSCTLADRLPGPLLLRGAEAEGQARRASTRSIPKLLETYEKLGIPLEEQKMLAGVAVDAVFDSVSVVTTFKEKLAKAGVIFCSISEAVREHPGTGEEVPRLRGAGDRQLLRHAQLGGVHRRLLRLHPQGRALPDGAVDLFPHQRREHRPVRAHADHRRQGLLRLLPGRLHRAERDENQLHAAVVELVALDDAEIKYSTVQNWYPGDKKGKGGIYNFVTKRGDCRGERSKILDPGRDRIAITWKYPSCILRGDNRWASSTRSP
jgi:Rrf2 family protein